MIPTQVHSQIGRSRNAPTLMSNDLIQEAQDGRLSEMKMKQGVTTSQRDWPRNREEEQKSSR